MYNEVLVTGGAGFVGCGLAIAIKRGEPQATVAVVDNLRRRGSELNLERLRRAGVQYYHGDIRLTSDLFDLPLRPELIIECSAEPSVLAGYGGSPEYLINTNLTGCFHCLELARRARSDFIFISTSRIYPFSLVNELLFWEDETRFHLCTDQHLPGASEHGISEKFPLEGPRSLYGMTKLASELMVEEYGDAYGFRTIINRCGLITGPWQMARFDQGVFALWVAAHYFRRELRYIGFGGEGKQVRDFLHIEDFCDLVLDQVRNFSLYAGRCYNVGGGVYNSLSLREATELCRQITGNAVLVAPSNGDRPADVRIYITDHRRVSAVTGWRPQRDASATLADIRDWIAAEEATLSSVLMR